MENINDLNNFLNERKVVVKRRYTEAYPAKNVSTNARVRNVILDAISDGHITKEEMNRILTELQANKRWLKRNASLFNISEDQEGVTTYSLSPYGQRIKDRTAPKVLNEALNVPHKERGTKPVNIFVGRFQPFTLGHVKVFEKMYKQNGLPVVVFLVRGGKPDPEKRPFDETLQQAMFTKMAKQYPFLETAIVVPNGAIDTLYAHARPAYEPMMWGFGTDRKKSYNSMITKDRYRQELDVDPSFKGFEIKRTDDNISASKVRNALKIDDEKAFQKMTPKSIHKFYKPLQNILQPIKENKDMKNLKSLNEYINEDNMTKFTFDDAVDTAGELVRSEEKGIASALKALGARKGRQIAIMTDTTEDEGSDLYDAIKKMKTLPIKSNVYDKAYHGKYKGKNVVVFDSGGDLFAYFNYVNESVELNEEYIELMPNIETALEQIIEDWIQWKSGPATEPGDIKPARKELLNFCTAYLKKNIK
jgi:hypothetical protein